jgi:hypothetical protein
MVDFQIIPDQKERTELLAALGRLGGNDFQAIHESLGEEMINIIRERFDTSTDAEGHAFKPIKDYIYRSAAGSEGMKRKAGDSPLKVLTLFRSFNYIASKKEVQIGTPVDYAKYHTDFPSNNQGTRRIIQKREFLGVYTEKDINRLRNTLLDALTSGSGGLV